MTLEADWTNHQPTYDELVKIVQTLALEIIKYKERDSDIKRLKAELKNSEFQRATLAKELHGLQRKSKILQAEPTTAMLQTATAFLLKQEMDAEATLKRIPMVKDPKTGKWVPR